MDTGSHENIISLNVLKEVDPSAVINPIMVTHCWYNRTFAVGPRDSRVANSNYNYF